MKRSATLNLLRHADRKGITQQRFLSSGRFFKDFTGSHNHATSLAGLLSFTVLSPLTEGIIPWLSSKLSQ
jgi:hypothetical protein